MDIDVGSVIAGKYELVRLVGKGAMGEVWLATHNSLGGEFAIKIVETTDDIEAETAAGRFQLEAQIAAKLSRKTRHIVSVSDHGEEDGRAYLVMELLEGESLEGRIKRRQLLSLAEVVAVISQVGRALGLAHDEGIFHRDLKPANVFLTKDEDGRLCVKLLDFGIARTVKPFKTRSPFATSKDMVLGTPSYMSPEQARGLDTLDYRCDLWALAVLTFESLTGRIPFDGTTVEDIFLSICTFKVVPVRSLRADLPPLVDGFFSRAFAPSLDARFTSAAEMAEELEKLVDPEELEAAFGTSPGSSRRLLAIRRKSNPDLVETAASASAQRLLTEADAGRLSKKSSDPVPLTVGDATAHVPKNRGGGWVLALVALLLVFGVGGAGLVMYRKTEVKPVHAAVPPPPATTTPEPTPTITAETVPPPPPAPTPEPKVAADKPPPKKAVTPPVQKVAAPPVVTAASPPPHPPAPPPSAKTPRKNDKADVF